jgi:hypothetical protein
MPIAPPESESSLPPEWSANEVAGTTAPTDGTPGMTVSGTGDKGLNLVGVATAGDGLAGVFIDGTGDEGITLKAVGAGTHDIYVLAASVFFNGSIVLGNYAEDGGSVPQLIQVSPYGTIESGALPTQQFVSGAAAQVLLHSDVEVHTPVTFNSLISTIATCLVELSPDNTTFSTLCTWTEPVGVVLAGTIHDVTCRVPAGWYLKLTVAQAVLGLSTYF